MSASTIANFIVTEGALLTALGIDLLCSIVIYFSILTKYELPRKIPITMLCLLIFVLLRTWLDDVFSPGWASLWALLGMVLAAGLFSHFEIFFGVALLSSLAYAGSMFIENFKIRALVFGILVVIAVIVIIKYHKQVSEVLTHISMSLLTSFIGVLMIYFAIELHDKGFENSVELLRERIVCLSKMRCNNQLYAVIGIASVRLIVLLWMWQKSKSEETQRLREQVGLGEARSGGPGDGELSSDLTAMVKEWKQWRNGNPRADEVPLVQRDRREQVNKRASEIAQELELPSKTHTPEHSVSRTEVGPNHEVSLM